MLITAFTKCLSNTNLDYIYIRYICLVYTEHNLQSQGETNKHKNKMDNKQMVFFAIYARMQYMTKCNFKTILGRMICLNTQHTSYIPENKAIKISSHEISIFFTCYKLWSKVVQMTWIEQFHRARPRINSHFYAKKC